MKRILKFIALATIILSLSETSDAKEWRGIIPLHSTRADVTRLLGPSSRSLGFPSEILISLTASKFGRT